jgi:hypothetical protein
MGAFVEKAQIVSLVVTVLVPVVTAMAGVAGVRFQDWLARRSQAGRRQQTLEDARRQVTFAIDWWNAKKLISDSPEAVQEAAAVIAAWLDVAYAQFSGSEIAVGEERRRITFRRLLLLYPLKGVTANLIRGIFYVLLGLMITLFGNAISYIFVHQGNFAVSDFIALVAVALVALGLRFWAVSVQSPLGKKARFRWEAVRRACLFYHLDGPAANVLRIVFYLAMAAVILYVSIGGLEGEGWAEVPANASYPLAAVGWSIGLRYWAASLGRTRTDSSAVKDPITNATGAGALAVGRDQQHGSVQGG